MSAIHTHDTILARIHAQRRQRERSALRRVDELRRQLNTALDELRKRTSERDALARQVEVMQRGGVREEAA